MSLNKEDLEYYFSKAKEENRRFIQVMIMMPGFESPEFIINSRENFEQKLAYYRNAYDENLHLKTCKSIYIAGISIFDDFTIIGEGRAATEKYEGFCCHCDNREDDGYKHIVCVCCRLFPDMYCKKEDL